MSQFIHNITNIFNRATTKTARFVKPRRVHQIQISHPRRLNAYKVAGYSFGALTVAILGPIVFWPIADVLLLPKAISKTLSRTPNSEYKDKFNNIWGRDFEISQIEYMMESLPNNIWILNGTTNCGKTAFIKKLLSLNKGIIYIDLRHFFDGNAFVFEMVDCLYNSHHNSSLINKLVGCYVKLFCFVTTIIAQSDQHITAMLYFHALLNHLKAGITKYNQNNNNKQFPLIIFDHFEALPAALNNTKQTKNSEMLSFIIYSISQFSSSICHDLSLSHVLFVGNDFFTFSKQNIETKIENKNHNNMKGCMSYLSSSIMKHCEYWNIDGVNKETAMNYIVDVFGNNLSVGGDGVQYSDILNKMALKLINCVGTKPYNISVALKAIQSNILNIEFVNDESVMEILDKNIINYIEHYNKSQRFKLNQVIKDNNNVKKLKTFSNLLQEMDSNNVMEWSEASNYFDNDQDLMIKLIDNNILSRKHGKKLSSNLNELMEMKLLGKDDSIYVGTIAECCQSLIVD